MNLLRNSREIMVKNHALKVFQCYSARNLAKSLFLPFIGRERVKRERVRFPLFVQRRYCVQTRTFLGVPDRS